ncbi:MAG TPA: hypothetical protein VII63_01295 [Caulobacteraceae bacterium]
MAKFRWGPRMAVSVLALSMAATVVLGERASRAQSDKIAPPHSGLTGHPAAGRDVFRFETFGNEGFWTDAVRLPKGIMEAKVTPIDALKLGLLVDIDAVPAELRGPLAAELKTDLSPRNAPLLNDPKTTMLLIAANAIPGFAPKGDKVGATCALCHTNTDASVFAMPGGGSIGHRLDGQANLNLNFGKILATADNPLAFYPFLQVTLGGKTIGRAPRGLTAHSSEADAKAYLGNPKFYPVGMFDDTPDGNGNPVVNSPLFRQDLAAPFGSAGEQPSVESFSNGVYTVAFDPTSLATPEGRKFLTVVGGTAGTQLSDDYAKVLRATHVTGYPFAMAMTGYKIGDPGSLVGRRVDEQKLADLRAYLESLPAPRGARVEPMAAARGRRAFVANCSSCHNPDQSQPVSPTLVEMNRIWPGYHPTVLARRDPPLDPIQNAPGTFDDKMIVVDASPGGGHRGNAIPMLLDLARKPMFLHDGSVHSLETLLDPRRGTISPHPFYIGDPKTRADVVAYLRGLDTGSGKGR